MLQQNLFFSRDSLLYYGNDLRQEGGTTQYAMKTRNSYKCVLLLRSEGATGSKYDALKCMQDAANSKRDV